ncbi:MAG: hypothetical protein HC837_16715 [Chloroflexaceae bacterium]|nr:hypothetical protein [Chloroflexaceae bacterium]
MKVRPQNFYRSALILLWLLFAACTATPPVAAPVRQAAACAVQASSGPLATESPQYVLDLSRSPDYCSDQLVKEQLQEALNWYLEQVNQIRDHAFPVTMMADLERYYTGDVLHTTRESLFHSQQAGRLTQARWQPFDENNIGNPRWSADGRQATIHVDRIQQYELLTTLPDQDDAIERLTAHPFERWSFVLVYDTADERWKIMEASSTIGFDF